MTTILGEDRRHRCAWSGHDAEYQRYHDEEWGTPLHGDRALFEKLSLEAFQAGLSWLTILRKRPAFREAFAQFEPAVVARFTEADAERLLGDPGIVRNRAKIEATIANARITNTLIADDPGAFDRLLWSFAPRVTDLTPEAGRTMSEESIALSGRLRQLGYRFVGPTTMYALMQSAGMLNDHAVECWRRASAR